MFSNTTMSTLYLFLSDYNIVSKLIPIPCSSQLKCRLEMYSEFHNRCQRKYSSKIHPRVIMGVNASSEKKLQKVVFPVKRTSQEGIA